MEDVVKQRIIQVMKDKGVTINALSGGDSALQRKINRQLNEGATLTYQTIMSIADTFPDVNLEWLLRGSGDMYLYKQCDEGGGGNAPSVTCGNEDIHSRLQKLQNELNEIRQAVC